MGPKKGSELWTLTQMSRECFCFTGRAGLLPMLRSKNHPLASGPNSLWTERLKAAGLFSFASGSSVAGAHGAGCVHNILRSFCSPDKGLIAFPPRKQRGGKKKKDKTFFSLKAVPSLLGATHSNSNVMKPPQPNPSNYGSSAEKLQLP